MPLSGALFASVTGLDAMSTAISVVGDNIANVNTTGYKTRRTEFADLLGQSISTSGGFSQIGAGAQVATVRSEFTQGTFENTNRETDIAIEGQGFFVLDGPTGRVYSRAGVFNFDSQGLLVNSNGQRVQGFAIDPVTGLSNGQIGDVNIGNASSPPRASTNITASLRLDPKAAVSPGGFDPSDRANTSEVSVTVDVYDSLGNQRPATIHFTKVAENAGPPPTNDWEWSINLRPAHTTIPPVNPTDTDVEQASGTLTFDDTGTLTSLTGASFTLDFAGGAAPAQPVTLDLGPIAGVGTGGATTQNGASAVNSFSQDGFAAGSLQGLIIDEAGFVSGLFSNGETIPISQLALANFANVEGMQRIGSNNLVETRASGQPLIGQPQTGSLGAIRSSTLELSNVDLATEFVRLIINQRAFQANTRTISTTNELLGDLVNLGR